MTAVWVTFLVILGLFLFIIFYGIAIYNHLIELKNRFVNAFSQIDVQLQRRYDLIPNLVETAKTYMKFEQETLNQVIQARNQAQQAAQQTAAHPENNDAMKSLIASEASLTSSLGRFFALVENYPDLKANQTMSQLMEELTSTENKVSFARQAFNDAVMIYNTYRTQFPNVIIAALFAFQDATHFEISQPEVRQAVKVSFN